MNTKIKFILFAFSLGLASASCDDCSILEEHPKKVVAESFLENAKTVEAEVNAIYGQLKRGEAFGRYLSVLSESLSDYCYGRGNFATSYATGLTTGGRSFSKSTWAVLYRSIRFGNEILAVIDQANLTAEEYALLSGEIRFLRAFAYSYLAKYYGAVPLFTELNYTDFNKVRTPEEEIWKYVQAEAEAASTLLPEVAREAGRPTSYSALLLKAEADMYLRDYSDAAESCRKIVESDKYDLVKVSVADDFDKLYGYNISSSPEEIFYIKYNREVGNSFEWMYLCKPNPVSATGALGIYSDSEKNKVVKNWDKNDLRYQHTFYHSTNGTLGALTKTGLICLKYRDPETDLSTMATDWPAYRYADAMLYYAEAICRRDGKPDATAMEMVNRIHRRAYGLDPNTPQANDFRLADYASEEAFLDLLLKEKGYEQCFEGKRYCDLKRQGKLAEYALRAGKITSLDEVKDAAYWWPIPEDEFNYNTNLDPSKDQNPGY